MTQDGYEPDGRLLGEFPLNVLVKRMAPRGLRGDETQVARFRRFAAQGDPLADALVARFATMQPGAGRAMFEAALAEGISSVEGAPAELVAFFEEVGAPPLWLDRELLAVGASTIRRTGLLGATPLFAALISGYLSRKAVKPLVATGNFLDMAPRRATETLAWWHDLSKPGALEPGAGAYCNALRVRLVHAHVRAAMRRRDDWDYDHWDYPVNQVQLVGTHLLFSLFPLFVNRALGIRYSALEERAVMHLWRYVGWLMGIDPDLLPADAYDAWRLYWLLLTELDPDEDSRALTAALFDALRDSLSLPVVGPGRHVLAAVGAVAFAELCRLVIGDEYGDRLELPAAPGGRVGHVAFRGALGVVATAVLSVETVRRRVPGANRVAEAAGAFSLTAARRYLSNRFGPDRTYRPPPAVFGPQRCPAS